MEEEAEALAPFSSAEAEEGDFLCFPFEGKPGGESCFLLVEEEVEEEDDGLFSFDSIDDLVLVPVTTSVSSRALAPAAWG